MKLITNLKFTSFGIEITDSQFDKKSKNSQIDKIELSYKTPSPNQQDQRGQGKDANYVAVKGADS